jgi:hypothetical protein
VTNPAALTLEDPLEIDDARIASRRLSVQRRAAEEQHEQLTQKAAEEERNYRKAFAKAFIQAEGIDAVSKAKAEAETAEQAYKRDLAAGMVKVTVEQLRGLEGERSQLKSLIEWSMRLQIDGRENYGRQG